MNRWLLVYFGFPAITFISKILPGLRSVFEKWFVETNTKIVLSTLKKNGGINNKNVFILLPHCLQFDGCEHRIVKEISNCKQCGKCSISGLMKLNKEYGIMMKVATGGRLAKRLVTNVNPDYVIAVACERELSEGICAVYPLKVIGVPNETPFGPCVNTTVDVSRIETLINNKVK